VSTPAPLPAASPPAAASDRGARLRLAGILLLAALVGAGAWLALRREGSADDPASVFDYCRDRTLGGDGGAVWRLLLPPAREEYAGFLRRLQDETNPALASKSVEWRRKVGVSREDLSRLPAEALFARENLAAAEELYRGARVYSVDRRSPEEALLHISLGNGGERTWLLRRVDGAWRIDNLWALVTQQGDLLPRSGVSPPGPVPPGKKGGK